MRGRSTPKRGYARAIPEIVVPRSGPGVLSFHVQVHCEADVSRGSSVEVTTKRATRQTHPLVQGPGLASRTPGRCNATANLRTHWATSYLLAPIRTFAALKAD